MVHHGFWLSPVDFAKLLGAAFFANAPVFEFVSPDQGHWSTVNINSGLFCLILMLLFIKFAPKKEKAKILVISFFSFLVLCLVILVSVFTLHGESRRIFCRVAASISTIVMYASPLFIMGTVMKTKSVEFMPLNWSAKVVLSGTIFFIYGIFIHDPFVAVPNAFGCVLGALQLELYYYYMNGSLETHRGDATSKRR